MSEHSSSENFVDKFKKNKLLLFLMLGIFIFGLFLNYMYTKDMKSLPSPIYGGDYYYQLGSVNHVIHGGNPFQSSASIGEIAVYQPFYSIITGYFAKLFGLDAFTAINIMSYLIIAIGMALTFYLIYKLLENYYIAFFGTIVFVVLTGLPVYKYTLFGMILIVPLFILSLYNFLFNKSLTNSIILGVVYGLIGITHSIIFITATFFLVMTFIYYELYLGIYIKHREHKKSLKDDIVVSENPMDDVAPSVVQKKLNKYLHSHIDWDNILDYSIVAVIGFIIAMLWWYVPVFMFHGKANMYIGFNYTFSYQIDLLWMYVKQVFFNEWSLKGITLSVFAFLGVFGILFSKNKTREQKFVIFLFAAYSISVLHFFITQNIFGINFVADYIMITFYLVQALIVCYGVKTLFNILYGLLGHKFDRTKIDYVGYILMVVSLMILFGAYGTYTANRWYEAGKGEFPAEYVSLQAYLEQNSKVTDTIITTKELGFAVNAVSGDKIVASRRGHAGQFQLTKSDERERDLAVMLYGSDLNYKIELFKKYNVKYLFYDYYWVNSEFQIDPSTGKVVGLFDPLLMVYSPNSEMVLIQNNVSYAIQDGWLDPSVRGDNVDSYRLIIISPQNYKDVMHPWNPMIDPYMKKVWSYSASNQELAALYEINY